MARSLDDVFFSQAIFDWDMHSMNRPEQEEPRREVSQREAFDHGLDHNPNFDEVFDVDAYLGHNMATYDNPAMGNNGLLNMRSEYENQQEFTRATPSIGSEHGAEMKQESIRHVQNASTDLGHSKDKPQESQLPSPISISSSVGSSMDPSSQGGALPVSDGSMNDPTMMDQNSVAQSGLPTPQKSIYQSTSRKRESNDHLTPEEKKEANRAKNREAAGRCRQKRKTNEERIRFERDHWYYEAIRSRRECQILKAQLDLYIAPGSASFLQHMLQDTSNQFGPPQVVSQHPNLSNAVNGPLQYDMKGQNHPGFMVSAPHQPQQQCYTQQGQHLPMVPDPAREQAQQQYYLQQGQFPQMVPAQQNQYLTGGVRL